ncbi:hypothetical protein SFRURICE_013732, partial [Spodoptera frugiperda]
TSATTGQGVSDSIPGSGKVLLGLFRLFEIFSVVARSLELCLVYDNRLTPYYMGLITQMVKRGCTLHSVLLLRNFRKTEKKLSNTSPDPGIEPETPCPAVTLATTRPPRQSETKKKTHFSM